MIRDLDLMAHDLMIGWRKLGVGLWGPRDGFPVFLLHGTPGSRLGLRPDDGQLAELGVLLVTYDRPGYGRSDSYPDRSVAQAADDVRAIADAFRLESFAVLGRSGGGPHALACAALLPERVTRVASLVGLAPYGVPGLDWLAGMAETNRRQYAAAVLGRAALSEVLFPEVMALRADPSRFGGRLFAQGPSSDQNLIADPGYHERWVAGIVEAVAKSLDGWAADNLAFTRPWGFEPDLIRVPTLVWHGVRDVFSPVSHARWLADRIRDATLVLSEHSSHLHASAAQYDALRWLVHGGPTEAWARQVG
jgi:pimeloyl-ACP methyl ester carboxylesterase